MFQSFKITYFSAQKSELELKCKKFAARFKVKEREVNALEEKLKIAKENASKNVNEEELIDSNKKIEELQKKVEDLQFTATNLDSALQLERERRRELENEKQTYWSQSSKSVNMTAIESDPEVGSSSFSLLIDEETGDKSKLNSAKRFLTKQKHFFLNGPPNAKFKRIAIIAYLLILHVLFFKMCLF
jgi:chromosome segregation ATPase